MQYSRVHPHFTELHCTTLHYTVKCDGADVTASSGASSGQGKTWYSLTVTVTVIDTGTVSLHADYYSDTVSVNTECGGASSGQRKPNHTL